MRLAQGPGDYNQNKQTCRLYNSLGQTLWKQLGRGAKKPRGGQNVSKYLEIQTSFAGRLQLLLAAALHPNADESTPPR
jgi:hypothetical protein